VFSALIGRWSLKGSDAIGTSAVLQTHQGDALMRSHARTEAPVDPTSPWPGGRGSILRHHCCHARQQHLRGGEEGPKDRSMKMLSPVVRRPRHRGRRSGRVGVICCEDAGINSRICAFVAAASIHVPLGGAGRSYRRGAWRRVGWGREDCNRVPWVDQARPSSLRWLPLGLAHVRASGAKRRKTRQTTKELTY
jgi:hypothetical protein